MPTAAKEPKRRFLRPLWREIPSGGQNLSGVSPSFRATGPWRGGGLGLPLPPGPPGLCHAVWLGGGPRAGGDTGPYGKAAVLGVGADTIRPPYPGQLLRLLVPGALSPSSRTVFLDSGSGGEAGAISCTARAGCEERPQGSVPRNGVRGQATGVLALLGAGPRGSLVLSIIGKNDKNNVLRVRRNGTGR